MMSWERSITIYFIIGAFLFLYLVSDVMLTPYDEWTVNKISMPYYVGIAFILGLFIFFIKIFRGNNKN